MVFMPRGPIKAKTNERLTGDAYLARLGREGTQERASSDGSSDQGAATAADEHVNEQGQMGQTPTIHQT